MSEKIERIPGTKEKNEIYEKIKELESNGNVKEALKLRVEWFDKDIEEKEKDKNSMNWDVKGIKKRFEENIRYLKRRKRDTLKEIERLEKIEKEGGEENMEKNTEKEEKVQEETSENIVEDDIVTKIQKVEKEMEAEKYKGFDMPDDIFASINYNNMNKNKSDKDEEQKEETTEKLEEKDVSTMEYEGVEKESPFNIAYQLDDWAQDKFLELKEELSKTEDAKRANEIRKEMADILGNEYKTKAQKETEKVVNEYEGVEKESPFNIAYQLDDWAQDKFLELKEELSKTEDPKRANEIRKEMADILGNEYKDKVNKEETKKEEKATNKEDVSNQEEPNKEEEVEENKDTQKTTEDFKKQFEDIKKQLEEGNNNYEELLEKYNALKKEFEEVKAREMDEEQNENNTEIEIDENETEQGIAKRNIFNRIRGWIKEKWNHWKLERAERKMERAGRKEYMAEEKKRKADLKQEYNDYMEGRTDESTLGYIEINNKDNKIEKKVQKEMEKEAEKIGKDVSRVINEERTK